MTTRIVVAEGNHRCFAMTGTIAGLKSQARRPISTVETRTAFAAQATGGSSQHRNFPFCYAVSLECENAGTAMQDEFREGDWVRHHSYPEPLRVVGTGTTIVVRFSNGDMRAFEPCELEKLSIAKQDCELRPAEHLAFVTTLSLICLIMLALVVIAYAGQ